MFTALGTITSLELHQVYLIILSVHGEFWACYSQIHHQLAI